MTTQVQKAAAAPTETQMAELNNVIQAATAATDANLAVAQALSRKAKVLKVGMSTGKIVVAMAAGAALTLGVQKYQARRNNDNMAAAQ